MSRVKSLMVSRVMELFCRRCLHVWRRKFELDCPWSHFIFEKLVFPYVQHKLAVAIRLVT